MGAMKNDVDRASPRGGEGEPRGLRGGPQKEQVVLYGRGTGEVGERGESTGGV
jgi:hypothetical protein